MSIPEIIKITIEFVSIAFITVGLFYTAKHVKLLVETHKQNHQWNRRKAALDFTMQYESMVKNRGSLFRKLNVCSGTPYTFEELEDKFKDDPELRAHIHELLNYFEYLGVGIKQGVFEETFMKDTWFDLMAPIFYQFRLYIQGYRQTLSNSTWVNLEEVVTRWQHAKITTKDRDHIA